MDTEDNTPHDPVTESNVDGDTRVSIGRLKEMAKNCRLDGLSIRAFRDEGHTELDADGNNNKQSRLQALDELVAQAQELDMGY